MFRRLVGRREDVAEEQDLLVAEALGDDDGSDIRVGHAEILGLTAGEAAGDVREAEQAGERVAVGLRLQLAVGVGPLADNQVAGVLPDRRPPTPIENRAEAIAYAVANAAANDVILVAGKGHEAYQEANGVRSPFDDVEIASGALANR